MSLCVSSENVFVSHAKHPIVLLTNLNLALDVRVLKENLMISTVIPGRKEPRDTNTFLQPLVVELQKLYRQVPAFDAFLQQPFTLRISIAKSSMDQAAMRKVLQFRGPQSKKGC